MTPTEQDKELREKVAAIIEYWDFSPLQDEDSRIERLKNEILQLITADRKRVALEARIDSLLAAKKRIYETDAFELGLALGIIDSELKKLGWTPGEHKAQLEEVK